MIWKNARSSKPSAQCRGRKVSYGFRHLSYIQGLDSRHCVGRVVASAGPKTRMNDPDGGPHRVPQHRGAARLPGSRLWRSRAVAERDPAMACAFDGVPHRNRHSAGRHGNPERLESLASAVCGRMHEPRENCTPWRSCALPPYRIVRYRRDDRCERTLDAHG